MGKTERFYCHITSLNPEVTGSCHLVVVQYPNGNKTKFVVDCGLFQETDYNHLNREPFPFDCSSINFAIITHNHADHMARVPLMVKKGYNGHFFTTLETARLMPIALNNSLQILKEEAKKKKQKPLYDGDDLETVKQNIVPCSLEKAEYVDRNIKITFFDNGHLIGAAMVLIQISYPGEEDINLFFTGDYKPQNIFREVEALPEWVYELPVTVITEATYGYMTTKDIKYHFVQDVLESLESKRTVLIFVFAQGRAQEILYLLNKMQKAGEINPKIPIRLDGKLAQDYTKMYSMEEFGIRPEIRDILTRYEPVTKENRQEVIGSRKQQIVLTTSGMADHGPAQIYIPEYIVRKDVDMYFTGYTAEGTFGFQLQHPDNGCVKIQGRKVRVKAQIKTTNEFSSHAKADELIELLQKFKHLNLVLINHGQKHVKEEFANKVCEEVHAKRVEILGEHTFMISRYGYVKHMGSKLATKVKKCSKKAKESIKKNRKPKYKFRRQLLLHG